jgi:hypothetical protein
VWGKAREVAGTWYFVSGPRGLAIPMNGWPLCHLSSRRSDSTTAVIPQERQLLSGSAVHSPGAKAEERKTRGGTKRILPFQSLSGPFRSRPDRGHSGTLVQANPPVQVRSTVYEVLSVVVSPQLTPRESPINSSGYGVFGSGSPETAVHGRQLRPTLMGFRDDRKGSTGRRRSSPLPKSNAGQSDAEPGWSARLGSPLALQRRAHPGEGGWIPARWGVWSTRVCI